MATNNKRSAAMAAIAAGAITLGSVPLIDFLARWEGRETTAYADRLAGGVPTVCAGLTNATSPMPVVTGDYWSEQACKDIERLVVMGTQLKLADCLNVPVAQPVFDALTSHAHNFGVASTCASRAVGLMNRGQIAAGCDALAHSEAGSPVWSYVTKSNGQKQFVRGLYNRRLAEREMCLQGATAGG